MIFIHLNIIVVYNYFFSHQQTHRDTFTSFNSFFNSSLWFKVKGNHTGIGNRKFAFKCNIFFKKAVKQSDNKVKHQKYTFYNEFYKFIDIGTYNHG